MVPDRLNGRTRFIFLLQNFFYRSLTNHTPFLSELVFQSPSSYIESPFSTTANFIISLLLLLHRSEVTTEHMQNYTIISQYFKNYYYSLQIYNVIFSLPFDCH